MEKTSPFKIAPAEPIAVQHNLDCVVPAWRAGIQIDMDVSGLILRIWVPLIYAGMTEMYTFMFAVRVRSKEAV
jgi:hypothetical protein